MSIKDWPEGERPREKLLTFGVSSLSDAELLAIFLRTGIRGKSAVELARDLLTHLGSLNALLDASLEQFTQVPGLGSAKYAQLQAVVELTRRYLRESINYGDNMASPSCVREFIHSRLKGRPHETFCCMYLNTQNQVIEFEELFRGTIDSASVYPREVVKQALGYNAKSIIAVHNHPSGHPEPSHADIAITRQLRQALELVDIRLLDHMIVAGNQVVSMAERQLI
ncbi:MAG: hypothetical protein CSA52_02230 [Gammaproteobacteria bacterium]|nr:MAG: hypothetical protein CSB48_06215 [Pseudomonadota bacterium]PIE38409.1 MAG: hypothetical protein CSA52_02230 [Gammaproteobacteria bacterium]